MFIRITTLVENSKGEHLGLVHEHGLSFLIEKDGKSFLFDTGQGDAIIRNAQKLALDIFSVGDIILSHGHYDHSGGITSLLKEGGSAFTPRIHVHKGFFIPKYGMHNNRAEFLGNDFTPEDLRNHGCPISTCHSGIKTIAEGVWIVGDFGKNHPEEVISERFCLLTDKGMEPDMFTDEIMMVIDSPKGLILLAGCSHPGIMNMIDTVCSHFDKNIYAILGGTHLVEAGETQLKSATGYLYDLDCQVIGVSHCTGKDVMETLSKTDQRFFHNRTGSSLIIS